MMMMQYILIKTYKDDDAIHTFEEIMMPPKAEYIVLLKFATIKLHYPLFNVLSTTPATTVCSIQKCNFVGHLVSWPACVRLPVLLSKMNLLLPFLQ